MIGTDSESLANKEGKLEETLEITSVSMGLSRDDRDKMPSILQKMQCKRAGGRNRKTVTCTAVIQTFILEKIFSYSHHL